MGIDSSYIPRSRCKVLNDFRCELIDAVVMRSAERRYSSGSRSRTRWRWGANRGGSTTQAGDSGYGRSGNFADADPGV